MNSVTEKERSYKKLSRIQMAPEGFEPPTPGLKVQCSDQAELRSHDSMNKFRFKKAFIMPKHNNLYNILCFFSKMIYRSMEAFFREDQEAEIRKIEQDLGITHPANVAQIDNHTYTVHYPSIDKETALGLTERLLNLEHAFRIDIFK